MALTILIVLPLAGAAAALALSMAGRVEPARRLAVGASLWTLVATLATWMSFDPGTAGVQFVERGSWVEPFGASYYVGVDAVGLAFVTLTAWLTLLVLVVSSRSQRRAPAGFAATILVVEASAIAAFAARDLLLFFVSSEVLLLATTALIGVWGRERRVYAATKYLLYQLTGSGLMLLALIWIAWRHQVVTGVWTFALEDLVALDVPVGVQGWLWLAFMAAFAVRAPLFPLHTWLPDALAQAPGAAAVLLGGVAMNVSGWAFVRIAVPLLPDAAAAFSPWLALLAVVGTVHGALVAMAHSDLRRVVAYLLLSHMGVVALGVSTLTAQGLEGAVAHLLARGLWSSGLLLVIGMLAERRRTTQIAEFGGLWRVVPGVSAVLVLMASVSIGLPGTATFVGVVRTLTATIGSDALTYGRLLAGLTAMGAALWVICLVRVVIRIVAGPITRDRNRGLRDLTIGEWMVAMPLGGLAVVLGVWSAPLLALVAPVVREVLAEVARFAPQVP